MAQWYCYIDGNKYGPVSFEDVQRWVTEGRVKPTDSVWSEGMGNWVPANSIPGLCGGMPPSAPPGLYQQQMPMQGQINAPGAVAALVCGIISVALQIFCVAGIILGIIAIVQAKKAKAAVMQSPGAFTGGGMGTAGYVLGIIGTVLSVFWLCYYIVIFAFVGTAAYRHSF